MASRSSLFSMIVFSAIVPHSPLLLPSIGKEHRVALDATLYAYHQIEQDLFFAKPDTIIVVSPHSPFFPDSISINLSPHYTGSVKAFGDHEPLFTAASDSLLTDRLQRGLRKAKIPVTLMTQEELDYGVSIPYQLLTSDHSSPKLIPISTSHQSIQEHLRFGEVISDLIRNEHRRVALIASADLSHHSNQKAPKGHRPDGTWFNEAIRRIALERNTTELLALDTTRLEQAGQCGVLPIAVLLGALHDQHLLAEELSYEAPFGVGYTCIRYRLR